MNCDVSSNFMCVTRLQTVKAGDPIHNIYLFVYNKLLEATASRPHPYRITTFILLMYR